MKQLLSTVGLMSIIMLSFAQEPKGNLVKNYSFENLDGKPKGLGDFDEAEGWFSATGAKADVFSSDGKDDVGAPDNIYGREKPIDGKNYAGAVFYAYKDESPRNYISAELKKPLEAGKKYCVTFNVSLSEYAKYAVNNIGAVLSKDNLLDEEAAILNANPAIQHSRNKVYTEQYTWEPVCGVYEAAGGEEYITIGNFKTTDETEYKKVKRPKGFLGQQQKIAYYFIENVTIVPFTTEEDCKCEKEEFVDDIKVVYSKQVSGGDNSPASAIASTLIYFGENSAEITASGKVELDQIVTLLKENPGIKLQLLGHMDNNEAKLAETVVMYETLALDRSEAVKDYLLDNGIAEYRLSTGDMKNMDPLNMGTSDIEIAKNRRVEFVVSK